MPFLEGNAVYMARVILHSVYPDINFTNRCEFAKNPKRESYERHAAPSQSNVSNDNTVETVNSPQHLGSCRVALI